LNNSAHLLKERTLNILKITIAAVCLMVAQAHASTDARLEQCRSKLKTAQKLDLLYGLDWNGRAEPKVTVGPTFFKIPIDAKEGFAETVNCFVMAGQDKFISFDLLDYRTGKPVGRFKYGKLTVY
jgi:hypothetical protein